MIETVTGQSYETFVQENIFEPHRIYYHGGQPLGYRGAFWRYPDEQITIIQLCNQEAVMLVPTEEAIAEMLLGAKEQ